MRFTDGQIRQLQESATTLTEQNPGCEVHFAQTEEAAPVSTLRYDADPPMGAYLTDQPLDLTPPLESRAQQILENIVEQWKALGVSRPEVRDIGHRELGGRSVHEWTVTAPGA